MRLFAASLPAALITLALFVLMQYLISSGRQTVVPPAHSGFVELIRLSKQPVEAEHPRVHTAPRHEQRPEDTPPLPPTPKPQAQPPGAARLAVPLPPVPPPALASVPDLGRFEPPPLDNKRAAVPLPKPVSGRQEVSPSPPAPAVGAAADRSTPTNAAKPAVATEAIGSGDRDPVPVLRVEPTYPRKAARARKEGWVKLAFTITEQGTVIDPEVLESRPRRLFNRSAVAAIRGWRFTPKVIDGAPVATRATQVIEFKLAGR